jgi:hypothetical protein
VTLVVAVVQVVLASQTSVTAPEEAMVVAPVESVWVPVSLKVVEVACSFQPVPEPVASFTSIASVPVVDWSTPESVVAENEMLAGTVAVRVPAEIPTLAEVVAPEGSAEASR